MDPFPVQPVPHDALSTFIHANWMLLLVFVASGSMLVWPFVQRRMFPVSEIGTLELTRLINSGYPLILDVREGKEYDGTRLADAVHVPLSELEARAAELAKGKSRPVVVYCAKGLRNPAAIRTLRKSGLTDVHALRGGLAAWRAAGLPVVKAKA